MQFAQNLSQFSIRMQILFSYAPVLLVLGFLSVATYLNFKTFFQNFDQLSAVTEQNLVFDEIEQDIVELQRQALVYSYVGYKGVLNKVAFLEGQLEEKFQKILPVVKTDTEIQERFGRLLNHYHDYITGFGDSVEKRAGLNQLTQETFELQMARSSTLITELMESFEQSQNIEASYRAAKIQANLLRVRTKILSFLVTPDGSLIKESNLLLDSMDAAAHSLRLTLTANKEVQTLSEIINLIGASRSIIRELVTKNSSYLHLVNVVLAGKAAEIDKLSDEISDLIALRSQALSDGIIKDVEVSQNGYIALFIIAGTIGVTCALLIAMGIARSVTAMTGTLSQLAEGSLDTPIPGQHRKDEVGAMAKAAQRFKLMAARLEHQTGELEEFAYRTSHDLRSPLISSIGVLSLVEEAVESGDEAQAKKGISLIRSSLVKLEALVQDIHALTRAKNAAEVAVEVVLEELVDEALLKFNHLDNFGRLEIVKDLQAEREPITQKSRLTLIVENLISNAIKYQDLNKNDSYIKISSFTCDDRLHMKVIDNGIGVPQQKQDQLFGMFQRFHPKVSFGSGLGLYMMKKSAEVLQGSISFKDTGEGSAFELVIPLALQEIDNGHSNGVSVNGY